MEHYIQTGIVVKDSPLVQTNGELSRTHREHFTFPSVSTSHSGGVILAASLSLFPGQLSTLPLSRNLKMTTTFQRSRTSPLIPQSSAWICWADTAPWSHRPSFKSLSREKCHTGASVDKIIWRIVFCCPYNKIKFQIMGQIHKYPRWHLLLHLTFATPLQS